MFLFFRDILELDTNLPQEKVHEATDVIVKQMNSTVTELKRLFLVEDLVDSVKVSGTTLNAIYFKCMRNAFMQTIFNVCFQICKM